MDEIWWITNLLFPWNLLWAKFDGRYVYINSITNRRLLWRRRIQTSVPYFPRPLPSPPPNRRILQNQSPHLLNSLDTGIRPLPKDQLKLDNCLQQQTSVDFAGSSIIAKKISVSSPPSLSQKNAALLRTRALYDYETFLQVDEKLRTVSKNISPRHWKAVQSMYEYEYIGGGGGEGGGGGLCCVVQIEALLQQN